MCKHCTLYVQAGRLERCGQTEKRIVINTSKAKFKIAIQTVVLKIEKKICVNIVYIK